MANRRGRGEGHVYKRTDGRWEARIWLPTGERRSVFGRTRADVTSKLQAARKARDEGLPLPTERVTVAHQLAGWLANVKAEVRPGSFRRYEEAVRLHLKPAIGHFTLPTLSPEHVRALLRDKLEAGLAVATVRRIRAALRSALQQAVIDGLVGRNVASLAKLPKVKEGKQPRAMRTLTQEQARDLLTAAAGDRLEAVYVLALTTGMRQGEMLGLKWSEVDLARRTLHVTGTLQRTPEGFTISPPKTAAGRRLINLTPEAVAALRRRKAIQGEEHLRNAELWKDTGLVFTNEIGRPIEKQNFMRRSFWPLLAQAGLAEKITHTEQHQRRGKTVTAQVVELRPLIRFHDLRHTAATLLLEQGTHPSVVAAMLGHAQASITLNVYSHALPSIMKEAAKTMERIFG